MPALRIHVFALLPCLCSPALATELVYRPINPSFGGNPLASSHLLSLASAQRSTGTRSASSSLTGDSQAELFVRQLQSRLLSSLASQVNDAIFGEGAAESGTIVFGEQTISFARGLEFITISILNTDTGERTEIQVPILQVGTGGG